jgi:hypothetical protein
MFFDFFSSSLFPFSWRREGERKEERGEER